MDYSLLFRADYKLFGGEIIQLPILMTYPVFVVGVKINSYKRAAGILQQNLFGFPYKLIGDSALLYQGYQVVDFKYRGRFFLEFIPYSYAEQVELSVFSMPLSNPSKGGAIPSTTATQKAVGLDTTTSKVLIAANVNRIGATLYNSTTANLYVELGAAASATAFSFVVAAGGYYELPYGYQGDIQGILISTTAASGSIYVTEFT